MSLPFIVSCLRWLSSMSWSERLGLAVFVWLAAASVSAQGVASLPADDASGTPWMLALSALRDEDSYEHLMGSLHVGLREETWLSVAAGRSRAPSAETDVRASLASIGLEHNFGPVGLALTAERWGDANNLESRDWLGKLFFGGEQFRIELVREMRDIDIYFSGAGAPTATDLRRIGLEADGTGIVWRYRFGPLWRTYGSWTSYDYPRRMRLIPRADRLDLLSTSTVTLAYGFVDHYATLGLERTFGRKTVNFDYSQDESAIDGGKLNGLSGSVLWPIAPRLDLEFRLGTGRSDGFGSSLYGGLTMLAYGGL